MVQVEAGPRTPQVGQQREHRSHIGTRSFIEDLESFKLRVLHTVLEQHSAASWRQQVHVAQTHRLQSWHVQQSRRKRARERVINAAVCDVQLYKRLDGADASPECCGATEGCGITA